MGPPGGDPFGNPTLTAGDDSGELSYLNTGKSGKHQSADSWLTGNMEATADFLNNTGINGSGAVHPISSVLFTTCSAAIPVGNLLAEPSRSLLTVVATSRRYRSWLNIGEDNQ